MLLIKNTGEKITSILYHKKDARHSRKQLNIPASLPLPITGKARKGRLTSATDIHAKIRPETVRKHPASYQLHILSAFLFIFSFYCQHFFHPPQAAASENMAIVIQSQQIEAYNAATRGFVEGCKGRNISVNAIYDLQGDTEEGKKVVQSIKDGKDKPKVILAVGILAAALAKEQFKDIHIIFCMVINHERFNLEGNNITGISSEASIEDQFDILRKLLGTQKNLGILYDPAKTANIVAEATLASKKTEFNLIKTKITSETEIASALENIITLEKIDALWMIPDSTVITKKSLEIICKTTLEHRLPLFCTSDAIVKAGALAAISPNYTHIGRQASEVAQLLLNNHAITSLGVKKPEKLKVTINTQTAKTIGINVSTAQNLPDVVLYP